MPNTKLNLKISAYPTGRKKDTHTQSIWNALYTEEVTRNEVSQLLDEGGKIINNEESHIQ